MTELAAQYTIQHLGQRGDGVAAGPVYAPLTLPSEVVTGTREGDRLADVKIVTPSAQRVAPPCPHFKRCGGCALQHASDGFVETWKADLVRTALSHVDLTAQIAQVLTSPPQSRRRAALAGRKTKNGAQVGFHVRGGAEIVAIPNCKLLRPEIMAALPALEQVTRIAAPRGAEVTLHVTATQTGLDLAITEAKPFDRLAMAALAPLAPSFARITWNGETALQQTPPMLRLGRGQVPLAPGAFLQATEAGEAALVSQAKAILSGATQVADLFAGLGTFTFPIAERSAVHAVEGDRTLLQALDHGTRAPAGLKPITTERRDLFRAPLMPDELSRFDAVLLDPPRAGAAAQVAQLAQSTVAKIAFISCNPATFARDAQVLISAGWRMGPITVVDQFRWSPHVELVTDFERA
ncbi:MAG: class I SAM-dependent RNA methyltransferase [Pseudomonadota bacterium]